MGEGVFQACGRRNFGAAFYIPSNDLTPTAAHEHKTYPSLFNLLFTHTHTHAPKPEFTSSIKSVSVVLPRQMLF